MKPDLKINSIALVVLWTLQCTIVLLCCFLNPNHFTTIDSHYYLQSAQNMLDGNGYSILENGVYTWNSTFPPGYSLLISAVAFLTSLPVLWASKVVNLLASGVWFWKLRKWYGNEKAVVTGSLLLVGPFLKLWCHTWSEPLFLVLLFSWVRVFFSNRRHFVSTFLIGIALLLVRYAGVFIIILSVGMYAYWLFKNRRRSLETLVLSVLWSTLVGGWLILNFKLSGEFYGSARFGEPADLLEIVVLFGKGLVNEVLLFRDTDWVSLDSLVVLAALAQLLLFFQLGKIIYKLPKKDYFVSTAFAYLLFLAVLRTFSPFDAPGYRLLSPLSFLIGFSILHNLYDQHNSKKTRRTYLVILLLSWLYLLPQSDITPKIQQALNQFARVSPSTP